MSKIKTNHPESSRRKDSLPKASKVEQTKEVKGAHEKFVNAQIDSNKPGILPKK